MSTRAGIGMTMPDGTVRAIHVHCDGYPKGGTGEFLAEDCSDREQVERLIFQGDERPVDMGDKETFPEQANEYFGAEYAYLFEDGRWLACELHIGTTPWEWKELTDVLGQTDSEKDCETNC